MTCSSVELSHNKDLRQDGLVGKHKLKFEELNKSF